MAVAKISESDSRPAIELSPRDAAKSLNDDEYSERKENYPFHLPASMIGKFRK
jgi:hypothetical protein